MKLLFLTSRVPYPLDKGDKLRAFHQLRYFNRRHEVGLICLNEEGTISRAQEDALSGICSRYWCFDLGKAGIAGRLAAAAFGSMPFQVKYFHSRKLEEQIRTIIRGFAPDHIIAQLVRTAEYVRYLDYPKTLDMMDALSLGMQRRAAMSAPVIAPVFRTEAARLKEYEQEVIGDFDHTVLISDQDATIFTDIRKDIRVIPNGVDAAFFESMKTEASYDIVFVGNMSYFPNIDAAVRLVRDILPMIRKERDVRLLLAGAEPSYKVRALESESVHISGWVDDIRSAYGSASIFVAPLRSGTGMQNKLLEAMASGVPCITTAQVNNAIGARDGKEVLLAETDEEFAAAALRLLRDDTLKESIRGAAREYVRKRFQWEKVNEQLENLILNNT